MMLLLTPLMLALGTAAVALLVAVVFLESGVLLGFFLPGDSLLVTGGLLVASGSIRLPIWLVVTVVVAAAVLGDQLGYTAGRRLGPRVFSRRNSRFLSPHHVDRAQRFFARFGPRAVVLSRFVPVVRTLTPFLAGMSAMHRRTFTLANGAGGLLWATGAILAGYFLGGVPLIGSHVELVVVAIAVITIAPVVVSIAVRRLRRGTGSAQPSPSRAPQPGALSTPGPRAAGDLTRT